MANSTVPVTVVTLTFIQKTVCLVRRDRQVLSVERYLTIPSILE